MQQCRVAAKINTLAHNPRPAGVKKLKGEGQLYRLRVGDYRILYQVQDEVLLALVVRVRHRAEVYRGLRETWGGPVWQKKTMVKRMREIEAQIPK